jgi:GrpB-like predicted nucleotidyltransferase (UPF0157 family)
MITVVDYDHSWPERFEALRDEYAAVKKQTGAQAANIDEYGQAKGGTVQKILAASELTEAERASIAGNQVPTHEEVPR